MRKSRPRARPALGLTGLLGALGAAWAGPAGAAIVDFDDLTGKGGPFSGVCEASFQVDDEYLALGVQLSSNDPAVCVIAPGAGAPSPPNVGSGITSGNLDFSAPVIASFFDGGTPAAVGLVTLTLTPSSSSGTTVEAYDVNGLLLGSSGMTGPGTHTLYFPRRIHAARVDNGSFAVDDITFVDPVEPEYVPALGPLGLGILVALLAGLGAPRLGFGVRRAPRALRIGRSGHPGCAGSALNRPASLAKARPRGGSDHPSGAARGACGSGVRAILRFDCGATESNLSLWGKSLVTGRGGRDTDSGQTRP